MTKRSHSEIEQIDRIRMWIREERNIRGWSGKRLAAEAQAAAERRGIKSNLRQQSIASFELGRNKSIPSWINLLAAAFDDNPPIEAVQRVNKKFLNPSELSNTNQVMPKEVCTKKIPPEKDLLKIFLGLLAPMDVNVSDSWSLKQQIAVSLAKRFPAVMSHPQPFVDI